MERDKDLQEKPVDLHRDSQPDCIRGPTRWRKHCWHLVSTDKHLDCLPCHSSHHQQHWRCKFHFQSLHSHINLFEQVHFHHRCCQDWAAHGLYARGRCCPVLHAVRGVWCALKGMHRSRASVPEQLAFAVHDLCTCGVSECRLNAVGMRMLGARLACSGPEHAGELVACSGNEQAGVACTGSA